MNILVISSSSEFVSAIQKMTQMDVTAVTTATDAINKSLNRIFSCIIAEYSVTLSAIMGRLWDVSAFRDMGIVVVAPQTISRAQALHGLRLDLAEYEVMPWDAGVLCGRISRMISNDELRQKLFSAEATIVELDGIISNLQAEIGEKDERLRINSLINRMSGIPNGVRMVEMLQTEWLRMARYKAPLGVIFVEVDHLRLFSDHYGPSAEERALRKVGMALDGALQRPGDLLFHLSSDRFCAILPDTSQQGVIYISELLCQIVRDLSIENKKSDVGHVMTVSIGGGCLVPTKVANPLWLTGAADRALYHVKMSGRNNYHFQECEELFQEIV